MRKKMPHSGAHGDRPEPISKIQVLTLGGVKEAEELTVLGINYDHVIA